MPDISGIELTSRVDHIGLVVFISAEMAFSYPRLKLKQSISLGKLVSVNEFTLSFYLKKLLTYEISKLKSW